MTTFSPDESPPKPPRPKSPPPKPDPEPSQIQTQDISSGPKACIRCRGVKSLDCFTRSAKDNSSKAFKLEEMKMCNRCAFNEHNARAAGAHNEMVPKSEGLQKQLSEEEYSELYGAKAMIKVAPAVRRERKDCEDDDESEYAPLGYGLGGQVRRSRRLNP